MMYETLNFFFEGRQWGKTAMDLREVDSMSVAFKNYTFMIWVTETFWF